MEGKTRLGVSRCLLGEKVRYDGGHKLDRYITEVLSHYFDFVGVCPEVELGLPTPREAMHLTGDPQNSRIVTVRSGVDYTEGMQAWAAAKVAQLEGDGLAGFIFKSRSPSSGMQGVNVYGESGEPVGKGPGLFAQAFMKHFPLVPVEDEGRLNDLRIRENFLERVFVYHRWQQLDHCDRSAKDIIRFHTEHRLLILAHSPEHYTALGRLAAASQDGERDLFDAYARLLMEGLRLTATTKRNTNVLHHIIGYFKKHRAFCRIKYRLDAAYLP